MLGVSGKFPPAYIGGVFSGQAVGGIFASVTAVVMIALGTEAQSQAFFCFLVAVVFLAGSLVFYVVITRSEFYQFYLAEKDENIDAGGQDFKDLGAEVTEETEFIDQKKPCLDSSLNDGPHPPPTKVVIPHKGQHNCDQTIINEILVATHKLGILISKSFKKPVSRGITEMK